MSRIGLGVGIDREEFNRRAVIALRSADLLPKAKEFVEHCARSAAESRPISPKQAQWLIDLVYRYRREISDQPAIDYAASRTRTSGV